MQLLHLAGTAVVILLDILLGKVTFFPDMEYNGVNQLMTLCCSVCRLLKG